MLKILSLAILLFLPLSVTSQAAPYQAILYPEGATIFEQQEISPGSSRVKFNLPQVAQPESLRVALEAGNEAVRITAIEYQSVHPEQPSFKKLRDKITKFQAQISEAEDIIQADKLALSYWQKQEAIPVVNDLASAKALSELIRSESQTLLRSISQTNSAKTKVQEQLSEAQRLLLEQSGNVNRVWQVELQLSAPLTHVTELFYDYRIHQAGWKSSYSLNAVPQENRIEWNWQAEIEQTSGANWNNIEVKLATSEPTFTLTPPDNHPWIINEQQPVHYRGTAKALARVQMVADEVEMEAPEPSALPQRTEGQLFDIYDLGQLTIASGIPSRVQIRTGHWPAEFSYLTRPLQSPQAFLTANLSFDEAFLPLPSGTASIQIEGVHVGQRPFALNEKQDLSIGFGSDPSIKVTVDTAHIAGSTGLIAKKETYNWNWTVSLTNNKSIPVDLRIEDSYPHITHDDIDIEELFTPPLPDKGEDGLLSWELELAPGAQQVLNYGYRVSHPQNMDVSLGR
jgi:uncharacterized protein (TIGR02231 family)